MTTKQTQGPIEIQNLDIFAPSDDADVDADCGIQAYGQASDPVRQVHGVWGYVNDASCLEAGQYSGVTWWFDSVKRAHLGPDNIFFVKVYVRTDDGYGYIERPKGFYGTGSYPCYSLAQQLSQHWETARDPLGEVLPRFWQLTLGASPQQVLLGGLLNRSTVYLAYDAGGSTDQEAVWRDINLPEHVGKWALRVRRSGTAFLAQLLLMRIEAERVLPPLVVYSANWSIRGGNALVLEPPTSDEAQAGNALQLHVEPA